jgi:hypothetical protein
MNDSTVFRGVIHGQTIELDADIGLPDGQIVAIRVQPLVPHTSKLPSGEGIRRSAGGWSDDPDGLDAYLEWNRRQRKQGRPLIDP